MTARKSERLLNLLITLLVARSYVSKARIREVIEDYQTSSDDAFEKMFERDKEELRSLGIPIEVGSADKGFDDEPGYRVERSAFELPDIDLEPEEAAVIGLAARVWQHAGLAAATSDALVKLKAAGLSVDRAALDLVQPQIAAEEPAFEPFWNATRTRTEITFDYRRSNGPEVTTRHLQPWGVVSYRGRWYVAGHDVDREATRMFRLSRVVGTPVPAKRGGTFVVPEGTDLRQVTSALAPATPDRQAVMLVREGAGHGLRRHSEPVEGDAPVGWDRLSVRYSGGGGILDEVLGYGADVIVVEPQELRSAVVDRLQGIVASGVST
ncbi:MAG: WYL domain-containing protein [Nocardioides sp.]